MHRIFHAHFVARTAPLALTLALIVGCTPAATRPPSNVTTFVAAAERTQGLIAPAPQGEHELIALKGPGVFVSAQVSKQGSTNDLTFVILDIDGRNVVNISFAALRNLGLTEDNPYGLTLLNSGGTVENATIGFDTPLKYSENLSLRVQVNEPNVTQIMANVIHGE